MDTGAVVLDKQNAIHPQNISLAIARALSNDANGFVYKLCLGNNGTFVNSSSVIIFKQPNTETQQADLYNQTYETIVEDQAVGASPSNYVVPVKGAETSISAFVLVSALLSATEPTANPAVTYTFDEVGLKTADGLLLTHLIFTPIDKTTEMTFLMTYTLEVSAA